MKRNKTIISFVLSALFAGTQLFAQQEKIHYEEAQELFDSQAYRASLVKLALIEESLGHTNLKIQALKIHNLIALEDHPSIVVEVERFMQFPQAHDDDNYEEFTSASIASRQALERQQNDELEALRKAEQAALDSIEQASLQERESILVQHARTADDLELYDLILGQLVIEGKITIVQRLKAAKVAQLDSERRITDMLALLAQANYIDAYNASKKINDSHVQDSAIAAWKKELPDFAYLQAYDNAQQALLENETQRAIQQLELAASIKPTPTLNDHISQLKMELAYSGLDHNDQDALHRFITRYPDSRYLDEVFNSYTANLYQEIASMLKKQDLQQAAKKIEEVDKLKHMPYWSRLQDDRFNMLAMALKEYQLASRSYRQENIEPALIIAGSLSAINAEVYGPTLRKLIKNRRQWAQTNFFGFRLEVDPSFNAFAAHIFEYSQKRGGFGAYFEGNLNALSNAVISGEKRFKHRDAKYLDYGVGFTYGFRIFRNGIFHMGAGYTTLHKIFPDSEDPMIGYLLSDAIDGVLNTYHCASPTAMLSYNVTRNIQLSVRGSVTLLKKESLENLGIKNHPIRIKPGIGFAF